MADKLSVTDDPTGLGGVIERLLAPPCGSQGIIDADTVNQAYRVLVEARSLLQAIDDYYGGNTPDGAMHRAHGRLGSALGRLKG